MASLVPVDGRMHAILTKKEINNVHEHLAYDKVMVMDFCSGTIETQQQEDEPAARIELQGDPHRI